MLLFALGLMSKPMLVTLPFVLLLLDYWPLRRLPCRPTSGTGAEDGPPSDAHSFAWRPLVEKIPLVLLAGASCVATLLAQQEALIANEHMRGPWRVANALVSYVAYPGQLVYPAGLAALYPHPGNRLPTWEVVVALLVLVGILRSSPGRKAEVSLSAGRMAVVSRHACAGNWADPGGMPGDGRPLHLPAPYRTVCPARMGRSRPRGAVELPALGLRRGLAVGVGHPDGSRLAADVHLVQ